MKNFGKFRAVRPTDSDIWTLEKSISFQVDAKRNDRDETCSNFARFAEKRSDGVERVDRFDSVQRFDKTRDQSGRSEELLLVQLVQRRTTLKINAAEMFDDRRRFVAVRSARLFEQKVGFVFENFDQTVQSEQITFVQMTFVFRLAVSNAFGDA